MDFEQATSYMQGLVAWAEKHDANQKRNEADARLHLIDQLIFDCLNWRREDVHSEEGFEGTYTDYSFLSPRRLLIAPPLHVCGASSGLFAASVPLEMVTGTRAAHGSISSPRSNARRHLNSWFAFTPCARATSATLALGAIVNCTI
jgi:hypothetical protein